MPFHFHRAAIAVACAALTLGCSLAWAQQLFELEPSPVGLAEAAA